ncbi:MAG TPA: KR domain-containing protein [Chitinophagales bacterium]|nr:KR domain-containing protein [Chitinophagales bacterium]
MKILIIGGTRLLGKRITEKLIDRGAHDIYVLSRKADMFKKGCHAIAEERMAGLEKLRGTFFDLVIDFIAYDKQQVAHATSVLEFSQYIFTSSCWMTKLNRKFAIDEFIDEVDEAALNTLPAVTQKYLINKQAAENFLRDNLPTGKFLVVRLPIFWGLNDHTKRLQFYISRLADDSGLIMVNGGENICQIGCVEDLAENLCNLYESTLRTSAPILEALPTYNRTTRQIAGIIADAISASWTPIAITKEELEQKLPAYLAEEPLWREQVIAVSGNNIFSLLNTQDTPPEVWLRDVAKIEKQNASASALRPQEIELIKTQSEIL